MQQSTNHLLHALPQTLLSPLQSQCMHQSQSASDQLCVDSLFAAVQAESPTAEPAPMNETADEFAGME